jgi:hypothetical protein
MEFHPHKLMIFMSSNVADLNAILFCSIIIFVDFGFISDSISVSEKNKIEMNL